MLSICHNYRSPPVHEAAPWTQRGGLISWETGRGELGNVFVSEESTMLIHGELGGAPSPVS